MNKRQLDALASQFKLAAVPGVRTAIIRTPTKEYHFERPDVQTTTASGVTFFSISGEYDERTSFPEEDIQLVCSQAGVPPERAVQALASSGRDIAQALVDLAGG